MATLTQVKFPTAATNVSTGTETAELWVTPTNVFSDNATEASITAATYDSPDISQQLVTSGYGFTVPTGATIVGITVEIDRRSIIAGSGKDFRVQLRDASGTLVGSNKADTSTTWPSTSTVATYGGSADTWSASPTAAMVNDTDFGVVLSASALIANADIGVDFVRITVHFSSPGGTRFYPRFTTSAGRGTNSAALVGSAATWQATELSTTSGTSLTTLSANTVTGPTSGIEVVNGANNVEWISGPLDADVTISGTILANIWSSENNASANVAINVQLLKLGSDLTLTEIVRSTNTTEVPVTTNAAQLVSTGLTDADYTAVVVNKGERLVLRIFGDDAGTMATGFTFSIGVDDSSPADANGDSWIEFTETVGIITAAATGSRLYLTDTASDVATSDVDREAWTSRGGGVVNDVTNTTTGFTTPIQVTDTAGGTAVSWYSKQLQAFTLTGMATANVRALESNIAANAQVGLEIARVDADGSNPTVWGYALIVGSNEEISTAEAAWTVNPSGDDLAFTDGQRVRLRLFIDDARAAMGSGQTVTTYYNGTSAAASGDTYVILPQTVTEFAGSPDASVTPTTVAATTTVPDTTEAANADTTTVTVAGQVTAFSPSVTADANVTPTTVVATAFIDTPSISATSPDASAAPSTVIGIATIPVPEVVGNANAPPATIAAQAAVASIVAADLAVTPDTVVAAAAVDSPTVTGTADTTPTTVVGQAAVPTPSVAGNADFTTTTVITSVFVDTPSVSAGGSVTVTPSTVAAQASLDIPTISVVQNPTVTPDVVAGSTSVQVPTVTADGNVTTGNVSGTTSVEIPTVSLDATSIPTTVVGSTLVSVPSVSGTAEPIPTTVLAVATVPTPTISATQSPTVTLSTVVAQVTIDGVSVQIAGSASVTPTTVGALTAVPGASASTHIDLTVGNVSAATSINSPSTSANAEVTLETIALQAQIPPPNAFIGDPGEPVDNPNGGWVSPEGQLVMVGAEGKATMNGSEGRVRSVDTEGKAVWN